MTKTIFEGAELIDRWVIIYCRTSQYQPKKK